MLKLLYLERIRDNHPFMSNNIEVSETLFPDPQSDFGNGFNA